MASDERTLADVATDLGVALASLDRPLLYRRGRIPVYPDWLVDEEGNPLPALVPLTCAKARTHFADRIEFYKVKWDERTGSERQVVATLSKSEAEGLLESQQLLQHLPEITAIHPRPLPIFEKNPENPDVPGPLRILPPGYDPETKIYTYGTQA